jgi:hypothetical protein
VQETAKNLVEILVKELYIDKQLQEQFHFHRSVVFESHLNLGKEEEVAESEGILTPDKQNSATKGASK